MMWVRSGIGLPDLPNQINNGNADAAVNSLNFPTKRAEDLPADVQTIRQRIIDGYRIDRNGDLLLYQTTAYEIEYITGFDFFFVNITGGDPDAIKLDAEAWFWGYDLRQEELCDLPVRFIIRNSLLREAYPAFTTLPTGCSPTI